MRTLLALRDPLSALAVLLGLLAVSLFLLGSSHATITVVAGLAAALGLAGMCLAMQTPPDP